MHKHSHTLNSHIHPLAHNATHTLAQQRVFKLSERARSVSRTERKPEAGTTTSARATKIVLIVEAHSHYKASSGAFFVHEPSTKLYL